MFPFRYCSYGRRKGYGCQVRIRIAFPHDDGSVYVEISDNEHDHSPAEGASTLTEEVKTFVKEQLKNGIRPQRIRVILSVRDALGILVTWRKTYIALGKRPTGRRATEPETNSEPCGAIPRIFDRPIY